MVDITGIIPLSVGGMIGLLINVIIITAVLVIIDRIIAHEMTIKKSFVMAVVAYLFVPIILSFANIAIPFAGYIIPLIIWIALGQFLLKGTVKNKAVVAAVAFLVYIILTTDIPLPSIIAGFLPL